MRRTKKKTYVDIVFRRVGQLVVTFFALYAQSLPKENRESLHDDTASSTGMILSSILSRITLTMVDTELVI